MFKDTAEAGYNWVYEGKFGNYDSYGYYMDFPVNTTFESFTMKFKEMVRQNIFHPSVKVVSI